MKKITSIKANPFWNKKGDSMEKHFQITIILQSEKHIIKDNKVESKPKLESIDFTIDGSHLSDFIEALKRLQKD